MTSPAIPSPNGETLKPCPFCGGNASRQDLTDDDNAGGSCITCDSCGASSPVHFDRKENLYDSWNRRSSSSREEVRREALEEAAAIFEAGAHSEWFGHEAADAIRALSQGE